MLPVYLVFDVSRDCGKTQTVRLNELRIWAKSGSCRLALIGVETNDPRLNEVVNDSRPRCDYFQ